MVVGRRPCAITVIATPEAFASAAYAVAVAAVVGEEGERPDARTVTESFMDVAKYPSARIRLVINTMHRRNAFQPYSRIRTLLELDCGPFAQVVVRIGVRPRSLHLV